MGKYVCTVCGYIYDEASGIPEGGIIPGTKWEALSDDWTCPLCGASKGEFTEQEVREKPAAPQAHPEEMHGEGTCALSFGELSALCSNLAKGYEKQYCPEEAALWQKLGRVLHRQNHACAGGTTG